MAPPNASSCGPSPCGDAYGSWVFLGAGLPGVSSVTRGVRLSRRSSGWAASLASRDMPHPQPEPHPFAFIVPQPPGNVEEGGGGDGNGDGILDSHVIT